MDLSGVKNFIRVKANSMPQKPNYNFKTRIKKAFLELLIFVIRSSMFLFGFLAQVVLAVAGAPLLKVAKFIFYKIVVKLYCYYWSFIRKAGWNRQKSSFLSFLFTEKIVHVVIAGITFVAVLTNLIPFTSADSKVDNGRNAIIYNLVQSEFGEFAEKEELIKESLNKDNLVSRVSTQKRYREEIPALGGSSFPGISSEEEISLKEEETTSTKPQEQSLSQTQAAEDSLKDREEIITYEVQPGDTVSSIADKFGVSVNTILWENDLSEYDLIRPGDKLAILPVTGVSHEVERGESLGYIANEYDVDKSEIVEVNDIENPERLSIGEKLIIPGGEKQTQQDSSSNSSQSSSESRSSNYSALSAVKDVVKQKKTQQSASNKMHWPTTGHRITQYYSWRHHGLDIADNIGTPLYAAEAGVVEFVGWSRGYGNNVVINHGGGRKTRYAHMNRFYVNRGERVSKGQTLGEMGNTGWSTGPHIHFEVVINGRRQNPLNYIK